MDAAESRFTNLKEQIKRLSHSNNKLFILIFIILKSCWFVVKLCISGRTRSETLAGIFSGSGGFQGDTFTMRNRYPLLFKESTDFFLKRNVTDPSILSFGCSTGEEVFTLGEYLPHAKITGVDINAWCIRQCLKKNRNPNFSFFNRNSKDFDHARGFDAIFCMAVFQRTENRTDPNNEIAKGHTFEQFENEIRVLDEKLKVGGLMIIDHSDFSFTDTFCASGYTPLEFNHNQLLRERPLYDRNNKKVADRQNNYRVFEKQAF